ncbi:MAG: hypothetical protein ABI769_10895 [Pseudomonadota bacterium]
MRRLIWLAISIGVVAGTAHAAVDADSVQLLPSPIVLPKRIGPMAFSGEPHKYKDPRLGISYQYGGDGLSLTVYVYDSGETGLSDGADTMPVCREYEVAKQGVAQAYQKVRLESELLVRLSPPDDFPLIREAQYEYEREGHPTISFIWITAAAKHFVKLRLSMDPQLRDELRDARRGLLSIVGDAIKPYLTPAGENAKSAGTSIDFNLGGGSDDEMAAGVMYLMLLNAVAAQLPEQAPVCGGEFSPTFETDTGIYRSMFALGEDLAKSGLGKRIAQIDKAGFLEEFVWVDRHREAWGTDVPAGLTIPEYEAWRKKNLKRFRPPAFGTVTLDHPRPLPLEPLAP